ncbi:hypothetical protein CCACVL1_01682, partial [Corchorus capsularis]
AVKRSKLRLKRLDKISTITDSGIGQAQTLFGGFR